LDSDSSYTAVEDSNRSAFKDALREGAVAVAFGVGNDFYSYSSGTFTGGCSDSINHGMTAIGFGVDSSNDEYIIVRNSWGASWGDAGYVNVYMGDNDGAMGHCDVYGYPFQPIPA